jgi:predicted component of type VI protein secretion system
MKLSLVVKTAGKMEGKALEVKLSPFIIGRDPTCHLRPASALISKQHCALLLKGDKAFVQDFGSTNGTFVNEKQVQGEQEINNDDVLRVGPLLFVVRLEAASTVPQPTAAPAGKAGVPAAPLAAKKPAVPSKPGVAAAPAAPAASAATKLLPPAPEGGGSSDDDIAALLLTGDDTATDQPSAGSNQVPDGTTVFDIPVMPGTGAPTKPKEEEKKKPSGNTSSAAAEILERMRRRPRPTS